MKVPDACPYCNTSLTSDDAIRTVAVVTGTSTGHADADGVLEHDGDIRMDWNSQRPYQVTCAACGEEIHAGIELNAVRALEQIHHLIARGYDHLRDGSDELLDTVRAVAHATKPLTISD